MYGLLLTLGSLADRWTGHKGGGELIGVALVLLSIQHYWRHRAIYRCDRKHCYSWNTKGWTEDDGVGPFLTRKCLNCEGKKIFRLRKATILRGAVWDT